ncbi:phage tail protein [Pseudomonas sp. WS 5027]|uniref:phage tail protein n=1 Tax=Pseudomonas sp. WS 5027 TaxID=2717483 RepID=UPI0014760FBA|nr:phage tail protein [Pseudomonas sp. WS 5027]NMY49107.1 phage tail protein [Pseudomonas sp. WS 5027]
MAQQMALGSFVFGLGSGFPYERLERKTSGGWVSLDIISSKPKSHNTGQGLESLRLSGKAQWAAGMAKLDELRAMADARQPYALVDGVGRVWGRWRINDITESQQRVLDDGTTSLLEWSLDLEEFVNA